MKRTALLTAAGLAAVLLLTGCQSHTQSCRNGVCHVTVNGAGQNIEVNDHDLRVSQIGEGWVRIEAEGGAAATVRVGSTAVIGPVTVKATSADGSTAKFDVR